MNDVIKFDTYHQAFGTQQTFFKCSGYGLASLINSMNDPVGLEIGCDIGDTTEFLLNSKKDLNLFSIDPYENYVDWNGRPLNEREGVFNVMMKRMSIFGDRFKLIKKTSDDAVNEFHESQFDFIFIDGLHTYEQLSKDCQNYYKFLKPGGIFSGHDFTAIEGVNKAANEFALKVDKKILTTDCDVWYWYK
jgi:SAM-dependent methyltransferase